MILETDHTFTLENPEKGTHRTFRIETQAPDSKFAPGRRVLSLLIKPDKYKGFAFVEGLNRVKVWSSCQGRENGPTDYERLAKLLCALASGQLEQSRVTVLEARPCSRCGETLTRPESIRLGIGPVCGDRDRTRTDRARKGE